MSNCAKGQDKIKEYEEANLYRISQLRNLYAGRRCFILGNGPSLKISDIERLKSDITFACNRIYLLFGETTWRPTYYTISDPLGAEQFASHINSLPLTKLFSDSVRQHFRDRDDITWFEQIQYARDDDFSDFAFSFDLTKGIYHGATTLYIQLQIALFMGFTEVYLLGVDFDYKLPAKICQRSGLGVIVEHGAENNHFHPNYRVAKERWWLADKEFQYKTFSFAHEVFRSAGRAIYNASRISELDVFPRVEFDSII